MKKFFKGFKDFISRGNVVDMAVGVVIGGSFGKIVTGLVNYIINPFVGIFVKQGNLDSVKTVITAAKPEVINELGEVVTPAVEEVAILWGTWLQTIIDFLITAFCIFIIIRIISTVREHAEAEKIRAAAAAKAEAEEKAKAEKEAELARQEAFKTSIMQQETILAEIRDIIKNK